MVRSFWNGESKYSYSSHEKGPQVPGGWSGRALAGRYDLHMVMESDGIMVVYVAIAKMGGMAESVNF